MPKLPTLARVPPNHHDLLLKATNSGVTLLLQNRYRVRYTGNKYSSVDINGRLWLKSKDLRKDIASYNKVVNKKRAKLPSPALNEAVNLMQDNNTFPTEITELSTIPPQLPPKKRSKVYRINKKEVRQRLLGYLNTDRGRKYLFFWTVTFFEGTPDDLCYRVFNIWLTQLRKRGMLKEYLWVAERQKNGTIHYHIAIPHFMNVSRANGLMVGTLKGLSKNGEIPQSLSQCQRYNGVDIAKNRKTKKTVNFALGKRNRSLANYLTKYVTKNEGCFTHLAWHNSRGYSNLFTGVTFTIAEFVKFGFHKLLNRGKVFVMDFAKFIPWMNGPPKLFEDHLFQLNSYLQDN